MRVLLSLPTRHPDAEKAALGRVRRPFCLPTSLITEMRKSCPFWSAFNFFGRLFLDGLLFWSVYYLSAPDCWLGEASRIPTVQNFYENHQMSIYFDFLQLVSRASQDASLDTFSRLILNLSDIDILITPCIDILQIIQMCYKKITSQVKNH